MEEQGNVIHDCKLEVSDDKIFVEFDGLRGEVSDGAARAVRERLAEIALDLIMREMRARRAEARMLASAVHESDLGGLIPGADVMRAERGGPINLARGAEIGAIAGRARY